MMDEFIHWPKPYLFSFAIFDDILSWMSQHFDEKPLGM